MSIQISLKVPPVEPSYRLPGAPFEPPNNKTESITLPVLMMRFN